MENDCRIVPVEKPDDRMWEVIGGGINQFNRQHGGPEEYKPLCHVLTTPDGEVAGGLIGATFWGWFFIELLFIREELRGRGFGHQLLTLSEEEARRRGVRHVFLDTFSFQAPEFYRQHGYEVFGQLQDFPPGHQRYYMVKHLQSG